MDMVWNGGRAVRVTGRSVSLVLDGGVDFGDRVFSRPGEYDVQGVPLVGVQSRAGAAMNTVFSAYIDGIAVCHPGALGEPLTAAQIDAIGKVDVLLLPLGGGPDPIELVNALDPKVVVPLPLDPTTAESFYRQLGEPQPSAKLTITADKLPEDRRVLGLAPPKSAKKAA
jgi:L-ascorbate metabolism protein UlaG (beta-lactamase superfamily)